MPRRPPQRSYPPPPAAPQAPRAPHAGAGGGADHSRAALAAALDPIITIDAHGVIESASDSVLRVFGWTPAELIGRNVSVLMPEPIRLAHDGYLDRYAATGESSILGAARRFDAQRKDGSVFPIELAVSRADVPTRAGPLFVGIIRDLSTLPRRAAEEAAPLTEQRRLQDLLSEQTSALEQAHLRLRLADRVASIGTLAAGLGHDMNNVLLPVRAQLNVLEAATRLAGSGWSGRDGGTRRRRGASKTAPRPADIRQAVKSIAASVAYLQQLADGLYYLAQDPDSTQPVGAATPTTPTDLRAWWDKCGVVIAKAVPRHVKLTASIPPNLPPVAVAPHRLIQAVLNLVVNAGEAIPTLAQAPSRRRRQGRIKVWARAEQDAGGRVGAGGWVLLGVTDNGTGMTPEVKRRAFELFFTTKMRGHGTGLGLPLVHKVSVRAGGSVEVDTGVGRGTTVIMRLPAGAAPGLRGNAPRPRAVVTIRDARLATLVRHVLEGAGFEVVVRRGGRVGGALDLWVADEAAATLGAAKHANSLTPLIIPATATFQSVRDAVAQAMMRLSPTIDP